MLANIQCSPLGLHEYVDMSMHCKAFQLLPAEVLILGPLR